MRYPRISQNIAVKFRRGVALGMTAVMLLTGTPATSITSHATETTGTEVTTQEQTSEIGQAFTEAAAEKPKTEETVEELNKQTNNSKYTGNVTSSYSWTDSSGTHFRWSVQKEGEDERDEPWVWNIYIWIAFTYRTKTVKSKKKKRKK